MSVDVELPHFNLLELSRDTKALWMAIYNNRQTQLGNTATIVNFGDELNAGLITASTFAGARFHSTGLAPTWAPNEALSAYDTPLDLESPGSWQDLIPTLTLNGTDEEMDSPDAAYWSRALAAFSVGAWVRLTDATSSSILAKYTTTGDLREWVFWLNASDKLQLIIYDEDDATTPNASLDSEADATLSEDTWVFVVATYDGSANASGINLYQDGVLVASTDTDDANFTSARDTTAVVELGMSNGASFFDGRLAGGPCGPFFVQAELTAAQVANLFRVERLAMGV